MKNQTFSIEIETTGGKGWLCPTIGINACVDAAQPTPRACTRGWPKKKDTHMTLFIKFDEDTPVFLKHDGGYIYGGINWSDLEEDESPTATSSARHWCRCGTAQKSRG